MAGDPEIAAFEARLRAMPEPSLSREERGQVERALAGGFAYGTGLSLDAHRVLARRAVERALSRLRARGGARP